MAATERFTRIDYISKNIVMSNGEIMGAEWRTYWSGRAQTGDNRPCVSPKIERDAELAAFWETNLKDVPTAASILDLACGTGVIVRHALRLGFSNVMGLDISRDAIALMEKESPAAIGLVGSAHAIPLQDSSIDVAASQFGFEYAGVKETISEVARILKPGGQFIALVHKTDGAIAVECTKAAEEAEAFAKTGFIEAAKGVFETADALGKNLVTRDVYEKATLQLRPAQEQLAQMASNGNQLAAHVLSGAGQMFQRRQNYALEDILGWLSDIASENRAHKDRMLGMLDAALCEDEMSEVSAWVAAQGMTLSVAESLRIGPEKEDVAWALRSEKPADPL